MILKNQTKKTTISKNIKIANSPIDKFFGLLLKKNPRSLLFYTRFGIHTFFLKKPIDVLILDSKDKVAITRNVYPNKILLYSPKFTKAIELPSGSILKSKTEIGDRLTFS